MTRSAAAHQETDGRILRGAQTRRAILRRAADIASAEGLEGLSIGRLATELEISKSGVFTHFGSKEELQLATVRAAAELFREHVVRPALAVPPGLGRVWALIEAWQAYQRRPLFPGGCFFFSAAAEFDARKGRVRDAIAGSMRDWIAFVERCLREAQEAGDLAATADACQLAFEIDALGSIGASSALLQDDSESYARARQAILTRLRPIATTPDRLPVH